MRQILVSLLALSAAGTAQAADLDYDYLRGADYDPPPAATIDWSGVYVGGHGGWTSGALDKRTNVQSSLANYANSTPGLGGYSITSSKIYASRGSNDSFGAFAGFNAQFDDVVLGIEADYTHNSRKSLWIATADSVFLPYSVAATKRSSLENYGTIRARAGYAIGNFLPYVTGGLAIGEASFRQGLYGIPPSSSPIAQVSSSKILVGVAAGAGIEYAITPNILLRAEYQYLNFQDFDGRKIQLNTVRGGAAVKF
ncbi:outer membrane protein [Methylobacterium sp. J-076]|uniref:outer membrane protein n=1 Tax=Methylobacterium sp. J-076 TaxID=2836655 RepID=UPI001FBAA53F|nr:outer membrane protein [Methylobacterium sp. J-076]MCJ2013460.1 porin family protein [Methylobacterium sp. J-076]